MRAQLDLHGRTALVCGASKGIGKATAVALADLGATVIALARSPEALENLVSELGGAPHRYVTADLDDPASIAAALQACGPVDIVVHNTGGPPGGPLHKASADALLAAFRRHVLSAQQILQQVLPHWQSSGYGRWVNVLSTSVREPIPNLGVSNLTRAAMASWSKTLSRELPAGATINNVLPGFTDTDRLSQLAEGNATRTGRDRDAVYANWRSQVPEGRLGRPEELGNVIAFLCSPAASYVRGQTLAVDGGRLRSI